MIVAVTMVRDEEDILPWTLSHMLTQVDHVIVADNGSRDHTPDLVADLAAASGRVTLIHDGEAAYWQARKMTGLARLAHEMGADWVVPFDADEAWFVPPPDVRDRYDVIAMRPHVFVPQPGREDATVGDPLQRTRWRQVTPEPHAKVMFRSRPDVVIDMGNHGVTYPGPHTYVALTARGGGHVRHYQYRSAAQVARKARQGMAAYNATGMTSHMSHWRELAALNDDELLAWWGRYTAQPVVEDPWPA